MTSIHKRFKEWARAKRADGLFLMLTRTSDPLLMLKHYKGDISDDLIDALLGYGYQVGETEDIEKGLQWIEVARQASLFGGSAQSLAECLKARANLLLDLYEAKRKATDSDTGARELLDEALLSALESLEILETSNCIAETPRLLNLISFINATRGDMFAAYRNRLLSLIRCASLPDEAGKLQASIDVVIDLYWHINKDDLEPAAQMLLDQSDLLRNLTTQCADEKRCGDVYEALGSAYHALDKQDAAFLSFEQAAKLYQTAGVRAEAFRVYARLQNHAAQQGLMEQAIEYGERGINIAPSNADSSEYANQYHLLAASYAELNRQHDAISAYHRAAEFYYKDEKVIHAAGQCLLEAAAIEEEIGMLAEAQDDLEKIGKTPGGIHTFWLAHIRLAELLWKRRGDLGNAIKHADAAIEMSVSNHLGYGTRAVSYFHSALAYARAGNSDKVLNRCESLLKLLAEKPEGGTISLGPLSKHPIILPSVRDVATIALTAAWNLQRMEEVARYREIIQSLEDQEADQSLSSTESSVEDPGLKGLSLLERGNELFLAHPNLAISALEEALPLLTANIIASITANRALALASLSIGEIQSARDYFHHALELLAQSPDNSEQVICHLNLGMLDAQAGSYESAYHHILAVIKIKESERLSLTHADQRIAFIQTETNTYLTFIAICMNLAYFREAFEAVEKIKSRVLLDLLGQADKKPIDYILLNRLQETKTARDRWIENNLLQTRKAADKRLMDLMEKDPEEAERDLYTIIRIGEKIEGYEKQAQQSRLFLKLESQNVSLSFDETRALCYEN